MHVPRFMKPFIMSLPPEEVGLCILYILCSGTQTSLILKVLLPSSEASCGPVSLIKKSNAPRGPNSLIEVPAPSGNRFPPLRWI